MQWHQGDGLRWRVRLLCMTLPFAGLLVLFTGWPVVRSLWLVIERPGNVPRLLTDLVFWAALANTLILTALLLTLQIGVGLGLALLLSDRRVVGRRALRLMVFSTHLIGPAFVAVLFAVLLGGPRSPGEAFLTAVGVGPVGFASTPAGATAAILLAGTWLGAGYAMLYLLAGLRGIDPALHEAAQLDGAGAARRLWHVTLPGLRPMLAFLTIAGSVWGVQLFELPLLLFNGPGPGYRGLTLVMVLYQSGIDAGDLHYAATLGWAVVLVMATLAGGQAFAYRRLAA